MVGTMYSIIKRKSGSFVRSRVSWLTEREVR